MACFVWAMANAARQNEPTASNTPTLPKPSCKSDSLTSDIALFTATVFRILRRLPNHPVGDQCETRGDKANDSHEPSQCFNNFHALHPTVAMSLSHPSLGPMQHATLIHCKYRCLLRREHSIHIYTRRQNCIAFYPSRLTPARIHRCHPERINPFHWILQFIAETTQ
jgi:hypothetical protein